MAAETLGVWPGRTSLCVIKMIEMPALLPTGRLTLLYQCLTLIRALFPDPQWPCAAEVLHNGNQKELPKESRKQVQKNNNKKRSNSEHARSFSYQHSLGWRQPYGSSLDIVAIFPKLLFSEVFRLFFVRLYGVFRDSSIIGPLFQLCHSFLFQFFWKNII